MRISIACPRRGARPIDRERLARRDPDLLAHDVDAGDELRDRMLDLEPAVDLDEVRLALGAEEELERPGALVADGAQARSTDASISSRVSGESAGDGDSSTSFW